MAGVSLTTTLSQEDPPIPLPSSLLPLSLSPSLSLRLKQPRPPPPIRLVHLFASVLCHFYPYFSCSTNGSPSRSSIGRCRRGRDCRRDWGRCISFCPQPCRPRRCPFFPPGRLIPLLLFLFLVLVLVLVLFLPFDGIIHFSCHHPSRGRTCRERLDTLP